MNGNDDSRAHWRSLALLRNKIIVKLQADYDAVETELKQLLATRPAPQLSASIVAYAAREAVRRVLPTEWQTLPDGTTTANLLAGTLANLYADKRAAEAYQLAITLEAVRGLEPEDRHG